MNREIAELLIALTRKLGPTVVGALMAAVLAWLTIDAAQDAQRYAESLAAGGAPPAPAMPFTVLGGTADFYVRNLGFGAILLVLFMAMAASGGTVPAQPEFDALGDELERRNERLFQAGGAGLVLGIMAGFAVILATGVFAWLGIFAGAGMLLQLLIPLGAALPGGRKRLRELMYSSERRYGRNSVWSWILAGMWIAGAVAAIAGGYAHLDDPPLPGARRR